MATVSFTIATVVPVQLLAAVPDGHSITNTGSYTTYVLTNPGVTPQTGIAVSSGATVQLPPGPIYAVTDNGSQTTVTISDMNTTAVAPTIPVDDYWGLPFTTIPDTAIVQFTHNAMNYCSGLVSILFTVACDTEDAFVSGTAIFTLLDLGNQQVHIQVADFVNIGVSTDPPYSTSGTSLYAISGSGIIPRSRYNVGYQCGATGMKAEILPYGFIIVPN